MTQKTWEERGITLAEVNIPSSTPVGDVIIQDFSLGGRMMGIVHNGTMTEEEALETLRSQSYFKVFHPSDDPMEYIGDIPMGPKGTKDKAIHIFVVDMD